MERFEHFSALHLDTLKEAGNIGAGNAATALSKLLGSKVSVEVPDARIVTLTEVTEMFGGAEQRVTALFLRIEGDAPGSLFFIVSVEEANWFIRYLTGDSESSLEDAFGLSALQEAGNILAGSYLSSICDFTGLNLQPTPPAITVDMAGAILVSGLAESTRSSEHAIMIETTFNERYERNGRFLLVPDPQSVAKIFRALGVSDHE